MIKWVKFKLEKRSPRWGYVRRIHLAINCKCKACDSDHDLEVHHVVPFGVMPELELDTSNLVTLCKHCHLVFGHLRDYNTYNPDVLNDCNNYNLSRKKAKKI